MERRATELEGELDVAQIAAGVACGYQLWREWLDDFRPGHSELARWYEGFAQRPSMVATAPRETPER